MSDETAKHPTFFLPGVGKSGTTSIYEYLNEHPEVFMSPVKEPGFFNWDGEPHRWEGPVDASIVERSITDWDEYKKLFSGVGDEKVSGEATPSYVYNVKTAGRILARCPQAKVLIFLRHPADRLFSQFLHMKRMESEPLDLEAAIAAEDERTKMNWGQSYHYVKQGYYADQLPAWFDAFGPDRIRVWLFDDLRKDSALVMRQVYEFLEVDVDYKPDTETQYNQHYEPKSQRLQNLINGQSPIKKIAQAIIPSSLRHKVTSLLKSRNKASKPALTPAQRDRLIDIYQDDMERLQTILDRDLSAWFAKSTVNG